MPAKPDKTNLPAPANRRVVQLGLAHVTKKGEVSYDWGRIRDIWMVRPETTLLAFAKWLEIPYGTLDDRPEFDVAEKLAVASGALSTWRDEVTRVMASKSFGDPDDAAQEFLQILADIKQGVSLAVAAARGKLAKIDANGKVVANPNVSAMDLSRLSTTFARSAQALKDLMDIGRLMHGKDDEVGVEPEAGLKERPPEVSAGNSPAPQLPPPT